MAVEHIRLVPSRLIVGIVCVAVAAAPLVVTPFVSPRYMSVLCNDVDDSWPIRATSVPAWSVFVVGYVAAFAVFLAMGLVAQYHFSYIQPGQRPRIYYLYKHKVPRAVVDLLRGYATYVFGTFITLSLTEVIKIMVGRPRPDFWAVCDPIFYVNNTRVDKCTPGTFVDTYECQNNNIAVVNDARLSFLSGHSSFSFYCATYLACYVERKFRPVQLPCLRLLLQVLFMFLALLVGLSRIVDNQHHWSDVLCGAVLGTVLGYYTEQLIKADLFGRGVIVKGETEAEDEDVDVERGGDGSRPATSNTTTNVATKPSDTDIDDVVSSPSGSPKPAKNLSHHHHHHQHNMHNGNHSSSPKRPNGHHKQPQE